ncbi:hypothetical protein SLEP1_g3763 [Rubroshorea leprosula]|uniref:Uncharacterized protein n=1 Tax=Rubroshorea leprosula TaxID=152421 RepID=A0AAV5HX12_9ROSI|nr:hypothetical protein SLEP1_g3763 [Rubroshorea leprosula]
MKEEGKLKTTFITQWGTFCYKVMPFGLKNAEATYQCSMIALLHDFVHTIVELYVADMGIMSKEEVLHTENLKVFECLKKYQLRLNPTKCTFDVDSGKLLGFIVSRRGIEINPAKIKALMKCHHQKPKRKSEAIKGQAIANHLAEHAAKDYEPIDWDFLDEDILAVEPESDLDNWKLFFNGAVNQLGCGLGAVLVFPKGIHAALDMNVRDLEIYGDSALIICQTNGDWQTKDPKLIPYHQYLETLIKKFRFISLNQMPRAKNQFADTLATLASMIQISHDDVIKPLKIEISQELTHCMEIKVDDKPWFHDIKQFLQNREYPLHAFEIYADHINAPPSLLHNMSAPWPFSMWGIDVIGAINPEASNGHQFILVAIDYFTKWMNGAMEAANKNIKKILAKMTITYKDWHEMLPYALHVYRTPVRTSTGATPYSLVYGMEVVLPIELEIPSMRILSESGIEEEDLIQKRIDYLNLLDEKRLVTLCHGQCYQQQIVTAYNKKVKPRVFHQGDLVLRKIMPNERDPRGKFAPNYEGPYVVKEAFSRGHSC